METEVMELDPMKLVKKLAPLIRNCSEEAEKKPKII